MTACYPHRLDEPLRSAPLSLPSLTEHKAAPRRITLAALERWVERADSGDVIEYHRGHLANDRVPGRSALTARLCRELGHVAARVATLAAEGRVVLTQKRIDGESVAYLAIRATSSSSRRSF